MDRSYLSTFVSFSARGLTFPKDVLQYFIQPDFKFWIRLDEEQRRKRAVGRGLTDHDRASFNPELIRIADEMYSSFQMIEIWNNETSDKISDKILKQII